MKPNLKHYYKVSFIIKLYLEIVCLLVKQHSIFIYLTRKCLLYFQISANVVVVVFQHT